MHQSCIGIGPHQHTTITVVVVFVVVVDDDNRIIIIIVIIYSVSQGIHRFWGDWGIEQRAPAREQQHLHSRA